LHDSQQSTELLGVCAIELPFSGPGGLILSMSRVCSTGQADQALHKARQQMPVHGSSLLTQIRGHMQVLVMHGAPASDITDPSILLETLAHAAAFQLNGALHGLLLRGASLHANLDAVLEHGVYTWLDAGTVVALNIELQCNIYCLFSLSLRFRGVQYMGVMSQKRPTAIKGTMKHAKTSFSAEIFAGAIISVVQYLAPLRY
jgi:hypothetical protein